MPALNKWLLIPYTSALTFNNGLTYNLFLFFCNILSSSRLIDPELRCTFVRDAALSNMADKENTSMEVDKNKAFVQQLNNFTQKTDKQNGTKDKRNAVGSRATAEYCEKLQAWMWQYYTGYVNWQCWLAASAMSYPVYLQPSSGASTAVESHSQNWYNSPFGLPLSPYPPAAVTSSGSRVGEAAAGAAVAAQPPRENGNAQRQGNSCKRCWFVP